MTRDELRQNLAVFRWPPVEIRGIATRLYVTQALVSMVCVHPSRDDFTAGDRDAGFILGVLLRSGLAVDKVVDVL